MTTERWRRILRVLDEAYKDYVNGMVASRQRVTIKVTATGVFAATDPLSQGVSFVAHKPVGRFLKR